MGRVIDLLHDAMLKVQSDGSILLHYDFIMNIFSPLRSRLPEFDQYLDFYVEEKQGNVVGSQKMEKQVSSGRHLTRTRRQLTFASSWPAASEPQW